MESIITELTADNTVNIVVWKKVYTFSSTVEHMLNIYSYYDEEARMVIFKRGGDDG